MADFHPRTLAALEAGPQKEKCTWSCYGHVEATCTQCKESPTDFARRIAQIAMEEEREECATICNLLRPLQKGDKGTEYELIRTDAFADAEEAIRRRGKP